MRLYTFVRFVGFLVWLPRVISSDRLHRFERMRTVVSRIRTAAGLMISAIAVGTVGYMLIEGASFFDSYYMTVITLASVGFSEIIHLSTQGRLFTSGLILFNIGLFTYSISTITGIFAEGGFTKLMREFTIMERIEALEGHTIVCGFGRHATEVAQELAKQGIPFVIIESRPEKIEFLQENLPYLFLEGDATQDAILKEAGLERASALVVTLPSDSDNLFIVMSARQMNAGLRIISRANHEADEVKIRRAGADHVVIPERIGGFYMATLVNKPDLVEFFTLLSNMGPSNVIFEEIPVSQLLARFQNRSIADSRLAEECEVPIVAIRYPNGQYALNPRLTEVLYPHDHIVVFGSQEQMQRFRDLALNEEHYG